jgi:energy-coupling factor transporter ATP-binding protein EcfA2
MFRDGEIPDETVLKSCELSEKYGLSGMWQSLAYARYPYFDAQNKARVRGDKLTRDYDLSTVFETHPQRIALLSLTPELASEIPVLNGFVYSPFEFDVLTHTSGKLSMLEMAEVLFPKYQTNFESFEAFRLHLLETVNGGKTEDGQSVWHKASPKSEELLSLGKEIARLEGENSALTDGIGLPVEIKETIKTLDDQIKAFDTEINACDAALKIISTIQKDCHQDSAPELNKNIGDILDTLTQHYKGVKIDDAMKLKVIDPKGGDFRDVDQLSAGTMDQVHFAFRYGISELISHEMPFILDEPFVRYDKQRKTEALKLLAELSSTRQVILFTCDDVEENLLRSLGASYHKIVL